MSRRTHDHRYSALIDELRSARAAAGLTQAELAGKLGRLQQFVSKYEARERRLDAIEVVEIAGALEVSWIDVIAAALLAEECM